MNVITVVSSSLENLSCQPSYLLQGTAEQIFEQERFLFNLLWVRPLAWLMLISRPNRTLAMDDSGSWTLTACLHFPEHGI
jgi:hypothetical protein